MKLIIPLLALLACCQSSAFNLRELVHTMEIAEEEVVADIKDSAFFNWAGHAPKSGNVVCPGGASECPDGSTCCQMSTGQYQCCPLPNAVCCDDRVHCCPSGYSCDSGHCKKGELVVDWFVKVDICHL